MAATTCSEYLAEEPDKWWESLSQGQ
jgi:hypothetical protein